MLFSFHHSSELDHVIFEFDGVIVVLIFHSEDYSEMSHLSDLEVDGQCEVVELLVLNGLDGSSAFAIWGFEALSTGDSLHLGDPPFVWIDVVFGELPLRRSFFGVGVIHDNIGRLPVQVVEFIVRLVSLHEEQIVQSLQVEFHQGCQFGLSFQDQVVDHGLGGPDSEIGGGQ